MATMGAEISHGSSISYCGFDINALPEELFVHVLTFVPAEDTVKRCSLVCKYWLRVSRDQSLWRRRCELENKYLPGVMGPIPKDFISLYFKNPYMRNLLRNTHAENIDFWVKPGGYLCAKVETSPVGADPIADYVPAEEIQGKKVQNWVTSYVFTSLTQQVRLLDVGCSEEVLDELKPPILASVWCAARWDCGARFQLGVRLLDKKQKELHCVTKEMELVDGHLRKAWHKVEHTFTDYKPGVRIVEFRMGGTDTQFWAGDYGAKFTLPCLRFVFNQKNV